MIWQNVAAVAITVVSLAVSIRAEVLTRRTQRLAPPASRHGQSGHVS